MLAIRISQPSGSGSLWEGEEAEEGAVGVPLGVDGREELPGRGMIMELESDGVDIAVRDGGGGRRGIEAAALDTDVDLGGYIQRTKKRTNGKG